MIGNWRGNPTTVFNLDLSSGHNTTYPIPNASPVRAPGKPHRTTATLPWLVALVRLTGGARRGNGGPRVGYLPRCKRIVGSFLPDVKLRACRVSARSESIAPTARGGDSDHVPNCFGLPAIPATRARDRRGVDCDGAIAEAPCELEGFRVPIPDGRPTPTPSVKRQLNPWFLSPTPGRGSVRNGRRVAMFG